MRSYDLHGVVAAIDLLDGPAFQNFAGDVSVGRGNNHVARRAMAMQHPVDLPFGGDWPAIGEAYRCHGGENSKAVDGLLHCSFLLRWAGV